MIRYGPAGIPLSCKGRTLKDGIEDVHNLALTALEIQMVRPKIEMVPPDPDYDVGKNMKELDAETGFVVGIEKEDGTILYDPEEIIEEEDNLMVMPAGVAARFGDLYPLGHMAKRHDVSLSLHTPYYMDLGTSIESDDEKECMLTQQYIDTVVQAGVILNALQGDIVVTNVGLYNDKKRSRDETEDNIRNNLSFILEMWEDLDLKPRLGIEITGQQDVFGSLEQVFDLCDEFEGLTPVLNFPHHQARTKGSLNLQTDFVDIINQFAGYSDNHVYASFSNVEFTPEGNEKWFTPLKKGELRFERLAEALADLKPDMTLISSSPLLEHDAVYMRTLTERVLSKKAAKQIKEDKKRQESATEEA
ncbi:MAG: TIM barrel protein [archaeon]|nr:TIM barrel protein [archaeon]